MNRLIAQPCLGGWNRARRGKEGNFLPVVCGTESSAVVSSFCHFPVTPEVSVRGKWHRSCTNWSYIWAVIEEDWADTKDGVLGDEWLASRYTSLTSLCHQSSFTVLFLAPSVFSLPACLSFPCSFTGIQLYLPLYPPPPPLFRQADKDEEPGLKVREDL